MGDTVSLVLNIDTAGGTSAVKTLSTEVKGLKTQADATKPALAAVGGGTKEFGDKATQAKGAVAALAAAMSMVSPEAARVVQGLGNISGALGGVGKAATLLGASAGPLALLAVAVGAIALAWKVVADNAKEAEDKQKKAAATATAMQGATNKVAASRAVDKFQAGTTTRSQAISELAAAGAQGPETQPLAEIAAARQVDYEKARDSAKDATGDAATASAFAALKSAKANAAKAVLDYATATIDGVAEGLKKDAPAAKGKAAKDGAAIAASTFSFAGGPDAFGGADPFASTFGFGPTDPFGGVDPFAQAAPTSVTGLPPPPGPRGTPWWQTNAAQGISQGLQGNAIGALSAIPGPAGMIAGGLSAIGEKGAAGVGEQLTGLKDTLIEAFKALPEILSEVIPAFIQAIITEVVPAFLQQLPAIILGLITGILDALNPFNGAPLEGSEKQAYATDKSYIEGKSGTLHGHAGSHPMAGYAVGNARVSQDMVTTVHQDEAILSRSQANEWRSGGGGSQNAQPAGPTYVINGPVGDAAFRQIILEQIAISNGPGGVGYSTGLAGGLRSG